MSDGVAPVSANGESAAGVATKVPRESDAATIAIHQWWDSGPYGGWTETQAGDRKLSVDVPLWLWERYRSASNAQREAEAALDDYAEMYAMRSCGHDEGWTVDQSYDPNDDRPHFAFICAACPPVGQCQANPAGHQPWNTIAKSTVLAWLTFLAVPEREEGPPQH